MYICKTKTQKRAKKIENRPNLVVTTVEKDDILYQRNTKIGKLLWRRVNNQTRGVPKMKTTCSHGERGNIPYESETENKKSTLFF